jgi:DNA repair photolyase
MIEPFFGEFLINPAPLDVAINYCSHKCGYCFANLNAPGRKYDERRTRNLLTNVATSQSLAGELLRQRYPVLMSNRVDPFATVNYRHTLTLLSELGRLSVPVTFQTRGGRGIDDALGMIGQSVWYVSIPYLDDELRRRLEPGAPPIPQRFELIHQLREAGHVVMVGINPLVREWLPNPLPLLEMLAGAGVWGVWVERLHLNRAQVIQMSATERAAIGGEIIGRAGRYKSDDIDLKYFHRVRAMAARLGLAVYSHGQPNPSNYWEPFTALYPKRFPTWQGFINYLHANNSPLVTFDQFSEWMGGRLPMGKLPLGYYLGATSRDVYRRRNVPRMMTYLDLLEIVWDDPKTKFSPVRGAAFAFVRDGNGHQLVDGVGRAYLAYRAQGFTDYWLDVDDVEVV